MQDVKMNGGVKVLGLVLVILALLVNIFLTLYVSGSGSSDVEIRDLRMAINLVAVKQSALEAHLSEVMENMRGIKVFLRENAGRQRHMYNPPMDRRE